MKRNLKPGPFFESMETGVCIFLLFLMSLVVIIQVFSRYIFNYSFVWAEELVRYLMIWMVMIGAAIVQSRNDHIRIDFFPLLAGPKGRKIMETVFRLCTLTFLAIIAVKGIKIALFNRLFESSGLRISMFWPTLAIPVGATLIGVYTAVSLVQDVRRLFAGHVEESRGDSHGSSPPGDPGANRIELESPAPREE
ncbi:MAG: TRAP transporter small permease [Deltaproteobacteria bacterium]|nr:TRAP transporter small permease [Deltaproteobacteria bacterium]